MPQPIRPANRIGVCSWSLKPAGPKDLVAHLHQVGLSTIQLGIIPLIEDPAWTDAPRCLADGGITITSAMIGTIGEDYSTLATIARTGGIVPDEHWDDNWRRFQQAAQIVSQLALPRLSFHAGFIPHSPDAPTYSKLAERLTAVTELFDQCHTRVLLETGQETADDLLRMLDHIGHPNLGVNFDPANMILYDKGDPLAALEKLIPAVGQVHIKDAIRTTTPGAWGSEVAVGRGEVDWSAFISILQRHAYRGDLVIEREAGEQRFDDVTAAARLIGDLLTDSNQ